MASPVSPKKRVDIQDPKLIDQEARVTNLDGQIINLAHFSELDKVDPDYFDLTVGLASAPTARFKEVIIRENQIKRKSRTQREEREQLLDRQDDGKP